MLDPCLREATWKKILTAYDPNPEPFHALPALPNAMKEHTLRSSGSLSYPAVFSIHFPLFHLKNVLRGTCHSTPRIRALQDAHNSTVHSVQLWIYIVDQLRCIFASWLILPRELLQQIALRSLARTITGITSVITITVGSDTVR